MTKTRPPFGRRPRDLLLVAGVSVLALAAVGYAARKPIAREVLTGWLRSHGVAATAQVGEFGLRGFKGRIVVGDPRAPDFVAGDAAVTYGFRGLNFEVRSVTLTHPVLRARLKAGRLSLGALDPLVEALRKTPPKPNAAKPRLAIEDGTLLLATDYGPVRLVADATMVDGKLSALNARSAAMQLKGRAFDVAINSVELTLKTRGDRIDITAKAKAPAASFGALSLQDGRFRLSGQIPYPDLQRRRDDGAVVLRLGVEGARLAAAGEQLDKAVVNAAFDGVAAGWIDTLTLTGKAQIDGVAASAVAGANRVGALKVQASAPDLRWSRPGGDSLSATAQVAATAQDLRAGDLRLPQVSTAFQGPVAFGPHGANIALRGHVAGHGGWTGLGVALPADSRDVAAVKRAVRAFRFDAPAVSLVVADSAVQAHLAQPLRVRPEAGGDAVLADRGGGAWRLTVAGGGLPTLAVDVSRIVLSEGGATVTGRLKAALSVGPVEDGVIEAAGVLKIAGGDVAFNANGCIPVRASKRALGANDVEGLSGQLCPEGGPLFRLVGGAWSLQTRLAGVAAAAPFAQVRVEGGAGGIQASQTAGRLKVSAIVDAAQVIDTAPARRFNSLQLSGRAGLEGDLATADLAFRTPAGQAIGHALLRHDLRAGAGGVTLDTGVLAFAEGGLQPVQLSPLASAIGSPATGSAAFAGRFDWTAAGVTSSGAVDIPRLDFTSPAGKVTGLSGRVTFTSLAPLVAAPGQVLKADGVDAFAALTGVSVAFEVQQSALLISGGEASVGGGKVRVESLTLPLAPGGALRGALLFEGVQLHDLVEASPFGDKVDLDARVSGRMPFESQDGKVRVLGGDLHAIQPGRLSIDRSALDAVAAGGSAALPTGPATAVEANDTFTDFAYQAMENLAFTTLDAGVSTHDDGRLGVLFHIIGKHDPPQRQEIKLSIFDLIGRKFLNRKLPLPSNTGVDLTLDTTLNLDDLLADYADYQRLRSSRSVQAQDRK